MGRASQEKGASLEAEILRALGARPGVVIWRNAVARATLRSGAQVLTGIGGEGAPDFMLEVRDSLGLWRVLWVESKCGEFARLSREQRQWHEAAHAMGRHVVLARSVADVVAAVDEIQAPLVGGECG